MSTRLIASTSILLVSFGLLPVKPVQAIPPMDASFCNQVYQKLAYASSTQDSKSVSVNGGVSVKIVSVNGGYKYVRTTAVSQSDLNEYQSKNCDNYIRAHYGAVLAEIQSKERINTNNNLTKVQTTQITTSGSVVMNRNDNRAKVQMNQEDNLTKRTESKNNLFGTGLNAMAQFGIALVSRPRNPEPAPAIANAPAPTQPAPTIEQPVQPTPPNPYAQPPAQVAYAPQPMAPNPYAQVPVQAAYAPPAPSMPFVMFSSNPSIPVSPVITAKVSAALSSQGLLPTMCTASPIVVLNIANGQYTACAQPSAAFPPGNYRLNIPGF
jgi:hypothetical protein